MTAHELLLVGIEPHRLHEDAVFDADLADVVQQARELDALDVRFAESHLTRDSPRDPRNPVRVASGEAIFRVDSLRERAHGAEEQLARLSVFREGVAREEQRNQERQCRPVADAERDLRHEPPHRDLAE